MKTSTWVALGGLGFVAWYLARSASGQSIIPGAAPSTSNQANAAAPGARAGSYDPRDAKLQPDFHAVVDGWDSGVTMFGNTTGRGPTTLTDEVNRWMYYGVPPIGAGGAVPPGESNLEDSFTDPGGNGNGDYYHQLYLPASRIRLSDLTVGDMQRCANFLAGAWKTGIGVGAKRQWYEIYYGEIDSDLAGVEAGAQIGTDIGTTLASLFGYGAAASSSDSLFGFGAGAKVEQAAAVTGLGGLTTPAGDLGLSSQLTYSAAPKAGPDGSPHGASDFAIGGGHYVGVLTNLFYGRWAPYKGNSSASTQVDAEWRLQDPLGNQWIQAGYAFPWYSVEMGANLSTPEWIYNCARMYRCVDLVVARMYPSEPALAPAGMGDLSTFVSGDNTPQIFYMTYDYVDPSFGPLAGSIFPPLESDTVSPAVRAATELAASSTFVGNGEPSDITPAIIAKVATTPVFVPPTSAATLVTPVAKASTRSATPVVAKTSPAPTAGAPSLERVTTHR